MRKIIVKVKPTDRKGKPDDSQDIFQREVKFGRSAKNE